jgi:hypothetical protein
MAAAAACHQSNGWEKRSALGTSLLNNNHKNHQNQKKKRKERKVGGRLNSSRRRQCATTGSLSNL